MGEMEEIRKMLTDAELRGEKLEAIALSMRQARRLAGELSVLLIAPPGRGPMDEAAVFVALLAGGMTLYGVPVQVAALDRI